MLTRTPGVLRPRWLRAAGPVALLAAVLCTPAGTLAEEPRAQQVKIKGSKRTFADSVTRQLDGKEITLELTGAGLREKVWVNVYVVGSYLAKGAAARTAAEISAADVHKELRLVMERKVDGPTIAKNFKAAIAANYSLDE